MCSNVGLACPGRLDLLAQGAEDAGPGAGLAADELEAACRASGLTVHRHKDVDSLLNSLSEESRLVVAFQVSLESALQVNRMSRHNGVPFLLVLHHGSSLSLFLDFGTNISYKGEENCGTYNQQGGRVHVASVSEQHAGLQLVTSSRRHGLEVGDTVRIGDTEASLVSVLSETLFGVKEKLSIARGSEIKLVSKCTWPRESLSLEAYLAEHQQQRAAWQQLSSLHSCLSSAAVSFLVDTAVTAIQRPGVLASADSWLTVDAMPVPQDDFLKDTRLLLTGIKEPLGAALLQLMQSAVIKELIIVSNIDAAEREELSSSLGYPATIIDSASLGSHVSAADIVVNIATSLEDRRQLDFHCVNHKKPNIVLAACGSQGLVECFVPHKTCSYSCSPDPLESSAPHCVIKSFPHLAEHAVAWAAEKLNNIIHHKPDTRTKFIQEHKDDLNSLITNLKRGGTVDGFRCVSSHLASFGVAPNWSDCVRVARLKFTKYFEHRASQLLATFPADTTSRDGSLFWSWPKLQPQPVLFDLENPLHLDTVRDLALCFAHLSGIVPPSQLDLATHLAQVTIPAFTPKNKTVIVDESLTKDDIQAEAAREIADEAAAEAILAQLPAFFQSSAAAVAPAVTEAVYSRLLVGLSQLRCQMYGIPCEDSEEISRIAARRDSCPRGLSSQLAGLAFIELRNILCGGEARSWLVRPGHISSFLTPSPHRTQIMAQVSVSVWDRWEVRGEQDWTLNHFIQALFTTYGVKVTMVVQDTRMVYVPIMPGHKARLGKLMSSLVKKTDGCDFVTLSLTAAADQEEDDMTLPPIKYYV